MSDRKKDFGWALKLPNGDLEASCFGRTRDECWEYTFEFVANRVGGSFRENAWGRFRETIKDADKLGYKMVKVRLVEGWE